MSSPYPPTSKVWEQRYNWLRQLEDKHQHPLASYLLSSHGTFVSFDLEIAFCAGAWVSVFVLAHAAIDATIRDTEALDYRSNSKKVFGGDSELEWLRKTRNSLVHVRENEDTADYDSMDEFHDSLEESARRAMVLVYRAIYANPGT